MNYMTDPTSGSCGNEKNAVEVLAKSLSSPGTAALNNYKEYAGLFLPRCVVHPARELPDTYSVLCSLFDLLVTANGRSIIIQMTWTSEIDLLQLRLTLSTLPGMIPARRITLVIIVHGRFQ